MGGVVREYWQDMEKLVVMKYCAVGDFIVREDGKVVVKNAGVLNTIQVKIVKLVILQGVVVSGIVLHGVPDVVVMQL